MTGSRPAATSPGGGPAPGATATRLVTARGLATRQRIVAAAAQLVYERGVAATSLDDVMAATATSKSQLYHYFADKAALVRAVIEHQAAAVLAAQQPEIDSISDMASLRAWAAKVVELNRRASATGGCPLGRLSSELAGADPAARRVLMDAFGAWHDRLAAGLASMTAGGDAAGPVPRHLATGLLAAVQGGLLLSQAAGHSAALEHALSVALEGIEASAAGSPPAPGR